MSTLTTARHADAPTPDPVKTALAIKAIEATAQPDKPRSVKLTGGGEYTYGQTTNGDLKVQLMISSTGIMLTPIGDDDCVISFSPMNLISLASGGEDKYYSSLCFIGKDKASGVRSAYVCDCGSFADEVLVTLGQAFTLARKQPKKKRKKKESKQGPDATYDMASAAPAEEKEPTPANNGDHCHLSVDQDTGMLTETSEAFALPPCVETMYELANNATIAPSPEELFDVKNPEVAKVVTTKKGEVDEIGKALLGLMEAEVKAMYDSSETLSKTKSLKKPKSVKKPGKVATLTATQKASLAPSKLITMLNDQAAGAEKLTSLKSTRIKPQDRPSWVYYTPGPRTPKMVDFAKLRKLQQDMDK